MPTMPRKTKLITYNLSERGYKASGTDRSNLDVSAMVHLINSDKIQEMVANHSMIGYYGHQIRQRYGMTPPETSVIGGKVVRLEPACKTVELTAKADGTVSHVQEFYDNESGEFARRQYQAKAGGFSTAVTYNNQNGRIVPTVFAGFDYVLQPNYAANVGDGLLFDGLNADDLNNGILGQCLEREILNQFDSIHAQLQMANCAENALDRLAALEAENLRLQDKAARRAAIQKQRQQDQFDSLLCPSVPFEQAVDLAKAFLAMPTNSGAEKDQKVPSLFGRWG